MRDEEKLGSLMTDLIRELGIDMTQGDLKNTPIRMAKMLLELTDSLSKEEPLLKTFPAPDGSPVVSIEGPVYTICEHHFLLMFGTFQVDYSPKERVIGISKVPRLVDYLARKPQLQERLTAQIAKRLYEVLDPHWVSVSLDLFHTCCYARGAKTYATMRTLVVLPEPLNVRNSSFSLEVRKCMRQNKKKTGLLLP